MHAASPMPVSSAARRSRPRRCRGHSPAWTSPGRRRPAPARQPRSWSRCTRRCCGARSRRAGSSNSPRALIIAPTRELAVQIHHDAELLGQYTGLTLGLAFGGVDYEKQRREPGGGRRRPDRHAGPPHRLLQAARVRPARDPGADPRRGRPHVRPRLHRRHPLHHAAAAAARPAPEHAVLGDPGPACARARLRAHERPGAGAHRAGQDDGRPGAPGRSTSRRWTRSRACWWACCGRWIRIARWSSSTRAVAPRNSRTLLRANGINAEAISGDVPQRKRLRMMRRLPQRRPRRS